MKKFLAIIAVAGFLTACNDSETTETTSDSSATNVTVDTSATNNMMSTDTSTMSMDTMNKVGADTLRK